MSRDSSFPFITAVAKLFLNGRSLGNLFLGMTVAVMVYMAVILTGLPEGVVRDTIIREVEQSSVPWFLPTVELDSQERK